MFRKPLLLRSSKLAKKRRSGLYRRGSALALLAVLLTGISVYLLERPEVTVQSVEVDGNAVVAASELENLARQELEGRYFFLFPRDNVFIFPRDSIAAAIQSAYERIGDIRVSAVGLQEIEVEVVEREPVALWCSTSTLVAPSTAATSTEEKIYTVERCYFLDESGYIFDEAPVFEGSVYLKYYGGLSSDKPVGSYLFPGDAFENLMFFTETLRQLGVQARSLSIVEAGDREIELAGGGRIIFGGEQDLSSVLTNLETVLKSELLAEEGLMSLDYLDLRFGDKVYYKFK